MTHPRLPCPVKGCDKTVSGYRSLGRHTRPAHNLCADCAVGQRTECRCAEERAANQDATGNFAMITLTDGRTLTVEGLRGLEEHGDFLTGEGVNRDTSSRWTSHVISRQVVRKVQPLAYNLITGLLEKRLDPTTGQPTPPTEINAPGSGQPPMEVSL